jgi:hypothetical protein
MNEFCLVLVIDRLRQLISQPSGATSSEPIETFLHNKLKHQDSLDIIAFFEYLGSFKSLADMDSIDEHVTPQFIHNEGDIHVVNLSKVGIPLKEAQIASEWIAKAFAQARKYSLSYIIF